MSTQTMAANYEAASAIRSNAQHAAETSLATVAQTVLPAEQTDFPMIGDISALVTFVPVGILAFITFGLLLSPL